MSKFLKDVKLSKQCQISESQTAAVADPGFARGGGAKPQRGGTNLLFGQKCPKNCMKIKEFGPRGGVQIPGAPLRSANGI